MNLPLKFGAKRGPVFLEDQSDVIGSPAFRDRGVDGPSLSVPQLSRLAIGATRAEDGLKRSQMSAPPENFLHVGKGLVIKSRFTIAARQGPQLPRGVAEDIRVFLIDVHHLKIAKIDRIGRRRPDAMKEY